MTTVSDTIKFIRSAVRACLTTIKSTHTMSFKRRSKAVWGWRALSQRRPIQRRSASQELTEILRDQQRHARQIGDAIRPNGDQ
jgi:hypothetical protein